MADSIIEQVRDILVEISPVDRSQMTLDATFTGDLLMDSLDVVNFLMTIEDTFGIEVSDAEADSAKTVGEACALLEEKLAQAKPSE